MHNRRDFLRRTLFAGGAALSAPMISRGRYQLFGATHSEYSRRTVDLVTESLVIDMLGLLTLNWGRLTRWERDEGAFTQSDCRKIRSSGINVFNPAVSLPAGGQEDAFRATCEWLRDWNVFLGNHPQDLMRIDVSGDLDTARAGQRIGVILGFQNSDHFRKVEDVTYFHALGQRISQLTYNARNQVGAGCTAPRDTGLTGFGGSVINEMNRLGMAVDVSHCGDCTTLDAVEASRRPVLITHANCRALNPAHPRCKPDIVIRKMAARGGVMGITGIRRFVRNQEPTTIENVLDHFDHVAELVGVEHLGIGSDNDLDGRDHNRREYRVDIKGLDHTRRMFDLTEGLVRRRYSDRSIRLILGGNFRRVLAEIWG